MCGIMTDMTDFIKGRGRLHSTGDVIEAAQAISEAGRRLDSLARGIAERCGQSASRQYYCCEHLQSCLRTICYFSKDIINRNGKQYYLICLPGLTCWPTWAG